MCVYVKSLQLCPTVCDPTDCSPPGSSVHGILQARILEWAAMPVSRGSSQLRDRTHVTYVSCIGRWVLSHQHHLGSLAYTVIKWLPPRASGGGQTPADTLDPSATASGVLTPGGSLCSHVPSAFDQGPDSGDWQLTQDLKGLFWEHLQKFKHRSGTTTSVLHNHEFEI